MQVTPEILTKYFSGKCSAEERQAVELWVTSQEAETIPWPAGEEEHQVKQQIWTGIRRNTLQEKTLIRRLYIPAAVACILGLLILAVKNDPLLFRRTVQFNNPTTIAQIVNIGHLTINIEPNTECTVAMSLFGQLTDIRFCGALSIVNTSDENTGLQVQSNIGNCTDQPGSDALLLHKGQTYLAMTDREYNMISATTDELLDGLPKPFSARLTKKFRL